MPDETDPQAVCTTFTMPDIDRLEDIYQATKVRLEKQFDSTVDAAHNLHHVQAVVDHVREAINAEPLDKKREFSLILAALLHEADDSKLFPGEGNKNSRTILGEVLSSGADAAELTEQIIEIIELVSAKKNKQSCVPEGSEWKLIVRDADRIEAVGEVGIARCYAYNRSQSAPMYCPETKRATSEEELWQIATPERFAAYNGSASMMDHYYDKLLHLQKCGSGNMYLQQQLKARLQIMVDFVLDFGRTGTVDVAKLEELRGKHCPEVGAAPSPEGAVVDGEQGKCKTKLAG